MLLHFHRNKSYPWAISNVSDLQFGPSKVSYLTLLEAVFGALLVVSYLDISVLTCNSPFTSDRRQVKKPPPLLQITSNFLVFYGLSHDITLEKKCVAQNLIYSKI